jgi:hypothetical protein
MSSSRMLCRVILVRTDVSEEFSASIIRMSRIGELGTVLVVTSTDARYEEIQISCDSCNNRRFRGI